MRKVTPELLACYLDDPTTPGDPELVASPDVAIELAGLAEVAQAITPPPTVELDPRFRAIGRSNLLNLIVEDRENRRRGLGWRLRRRLVSAPSQAKPGLGPFRLAGLPAFGVGVALVASATFGTGIVRAAADSLPGDTFYPVKLTIEGLGVALATSDQARAQALLAVADNRLAEMQQASQSGLVDATTVAAGAYVDDVTEASDYLARAEAKQPVAALATTVSVSLTQQEVTLAAAEVQAAPAAQPALKTASAALKQSIAVAAARETGSAPPPLVAAGSTRAPSPPGHADESARAAMVIRAGEPTRVAGPGRVDNPSRVATVTATRPPVPQPTAKPTPVPVISAPTPQPTEGPTPPRDDRLRNDRPKDDQPKGEPGKIDQTNNDQATSDQQLSRQRAAIRTGRIIADRIRLTAKRR
jgi:hypothetical protein